MAAGEEAEPEEAEGQAVVLQGGLGVVEAGRAVRVMEKLEQQDSGSLQGQEDGSGGAWDEDEREFGEKQRNWECGGIGSEGLSTNNSQKEEQQERKQQQVGMAVEGGCKENRRDSQQQQQERLSEVKAAAVKQGETPEHLLPGAAVAADVAQGGKVADAAAAGTALAEVGAEAVPGAGVLGGGAPGFSALVLLDVSYNLIPAEELLGVSSPLAHLPR